MRATDANSAEKWATRCVIAPCILMVEMQDLSWVNALNVASGGTKRSTVSSFLVLRVCVGRGGYCAGFTPSSESTLLCDGGWAACCLCVTR